MFVLAACGGTTEPLPNGGSDGGGGGQDAGLICSGELVACSGGCRDLSSDALNCGECGNACAAGLVCAGGACEPTCGNGRLDTAEDCDDDNALSGDGCSSSCELEEGFTCAGAPSQCFTTCGDGTAAGEEICDDGNADSDDGCSDACLIERGYVCTGAPSICGEICGDGQLVGNESCDDGDTTGGDGCSESCRIESGYSCSGTPSVCATTCGDGIPAGLESCDDGDALGGDGCSGACILEPGYTCTGAPSTCVTTCGDGIRAGNETCDDRNATGGDGCSAQCLAETGYSCTGSPSACVPVCGDGLRVGAEQCDDSNLIAGDGCTAACVIEPGYGCSAGNPSACAPICGDGVKKGAEQCDDRNTVAGDGCSAACVQEQGFTCSGSPSVCATICGDGRVKGNEACDDGNLGNNDGCSSTCAIEGGYACAGAPSVCGAVCGDGTIRGTEQCDDGDSTSGDGCSASCAVESGWSCLGAPSSCSAICGDGNIRGSEACDDGNINSNDGCSATCRVETGYTCNGAPSACGAICGDGLKKGTEQCDDGNAGSNDGCSATCAIESGWSCAGAPSACGPVCGDGVKKGSETCDDGDATAGDGCSATCRVETGFTCSSASPSVCGAVCGDGLIRGVETCDDGNGTASDGCDASCAVESGWSCAGAPSACGTTCGDGIRAGVEWCDDGNTTGGDCCSAVCTPEPGCETEPNDSTATANDWASINVSGRVKGFITPSGDLDLYSITLSHAGNARLIAETFDGPLGTTCASNKVDTYLTLRDAAGNSLGTDDDSGTGWCSKLTSNALLAGQYFVEVKRSGLNGPINDYTLDVSVVPLVCGDGIVEPGERCDDGNTTNGDGCSSLCAWETRSEIEANDTPATANAFAVGTLISGSIATVGDFDWYRFTLASTSDVEIETFDQFGPSTCTSVDTTLDLFDASAIWMIAWDNDSGVTWCSKIEAATHPGARQLPAGTYYVRIGESGVNGTIPGYTLRFRVTAVCGNGVAEGYEECDGTAGCTATCQRLQICGDGFVDGSETCDDGNTGSGDGCSSTCVVESTPEVEPNDSTALAAGSSVQISATRRISGSISVGSDRDFYRVNVAAPSVVRFETFGPVLGDCPSGMGTTLRVYNAAGSEFVNDSTSGIGNCSAVVANLSVGTWYVSVEDAGLNDAIGAYILETVFETNRGSETEPNDTRNEPDAVSGTDVYVLGGHQLNLDEDWFAITVPAGRSVRAEIIEGGAETCESNGIDSEITLFDASGNQLANDDDDGRGYCSKIDGTGVAAVDTGARNLPGGIYYIRVAASDVISDTSAGGQFDYRLVVTIR